VEFASNKWAIKSQPNLKYYLFGYVEGKNPLWFISGREWMSKPDPNIVNWKSTLTIAFSPLQFIYFIFFSAASSYLPTPDPRLCEGDHCLKKVLEVATTKNLILFCLDWFEKLWYKEEHKVIHYLLEVRIFSAGQDCCPCR